MIGESFPLYRNASCYNSIENGRDNEQAVLPVEYLYKNAQLHCMPRVCPTFSSADRLLKPYMNLASETFCHSKDAKGYSYNVVYGHAIDIIRQEHL